jgi:hypothetical protein
MYSGQKVTIAIKNSFGFESYSLDWSAGQATTPPDLGAAIFTALQGNLKSLDLWQGQERSAREAFPAVAPMACDASKIKAATAGDDATYGAVIMGCLDELKPIQTDAANVYSQIQPVIWPTSHPVKYSKAATAIGLPAAEGRADREWEIALSCEVLGKDRFSDALGNPVQDSEGQPVLDFNQQPITCSTASLPVKPGLASRMATVSIKIGSVVSALNPSSGPLTTNYNVLSALQILQDLKVTLDSTRTDLLSYGQRVAALVIDPPAHVNVVGSIPEVRSTATVIPQVTYNLNALNLVANNSSITDSTKKQLVVSITVIYGDVSWETSAGTFFSSLPVRSFAAAPVFVSDAITDKKVTETLVRPLVIPFGAVNYRLSDDWRKPKWRTNWYWTSAVGINPNTVTADFATGPSWAYRALMVSGLWHVGHDIHLTQGVKVGDSLGPSFSGSLPTKTAWTFSSGGIGISIRVPAITGR